MLTKFLRCVSTLLVVVMLANMVPVQALSNARTESIGQIDGTEIIEAFPSESLGSADEAVIVGEIADGRTEYSKEFLLSDGLHLATVYPEPVHHMKILTTPLLPTAKAATAIQPVFGMYPSPKAPAVKKLLRSRRTATPFLSECPKSWHRGTAPVQK